MTCTCHDPYVFGHLACGRETQGWTQPPLHTWTAGTAMQEIYGTDYGNYAETSTLRGRMYQNDETFTIPETATIHIANPPQPPATMWNWAEIGQTDLIQIELRQIGEPCG